MTDVGQSLTIIGELEEQSCSYPHGPLAPFVLPLRAESLPRLHVSIPTFKAPSHSDSATPQSESPLTPASLSSPIAGVVDLTNRVKTTSSGPVAHGGLSDIYKGVRYGSGSGEEEGDETILVAIKVLRILSIKDRDDARARKRLNREVYVWHRLEHPNVVKLFGTSYHMGGRPAMVMRWYENGSAAEYLSRKNPAADRVALILDVARGLAYLHTNKPPIVHGDLKGNNVLITDEGRAALCDFGLSKVIDELGGSSGYTLSNPDVGPLRWQAPEFLEDEDAPMSPSSDVWSFACTAFELLTSRIPYAHRARDGLVIKDMQNRIKPPGPADILLNAFDPRIGTILDLCWSFYPEGRPTMTTVVEHLESTYEGL